MVRVGGLLPNRLLELGFCRCSIFFLALTQIQIESRSVFFSVIIIQFPLAKELVIAHLCETCAKWCSKPTARRTAKRRLAVQVQWKLTREPK